MNEEELTLAVEEVPEPVAEIAVDPRPFLSTPLNDYTVTEGLLLLILVILFINMLGRALKEGFSWLTL